jgi:hypothetical protein
MLICKGDGKLMVNTKNGDVVWAEVSTPTLDWCVQKGYKDVVKLEGALNLDSHELELPECENCPKYELCCADLENDSRIPDNTFCIAIDDKVTGKTILAALAALDEDTKNEVLGYFN